MIRKWSRASPQRLLSRSSTSPAHPHQAFKLMRADGKSLPPVAIESPYEAPVAGHPKPLMQELRWYLEGFLDYPFPPEIDSRRPHPRRA